MPASYATHRKQLQLILQAWGMPEETAESTAEIMSWADLHGIDTHGISMVPPYDERRRAGKIDMRAVPRVARETPVSALIDGGGDVPILLGSAAFHDEQRHRAARYEVPIGAREPSRADRL